LQKLLLKKFYLILQTNLWIKKRLIIVFQFFLLTRTIVN